MLNESIIAIPNITFNGSDVILNQYVCPNLVNANPSLLMLSIFVLIIVLAKILKDLNSKYNFTKYNLDTDEIIFTCCIFLMMKYTLGIAEMITLALGIFLYYRSFVKEIAKLTINRFKVNKNMRDN